jgi:hypothetical protein
LLSPAQASAHFTGKGEAFDLHQLNQSLKTPQVDPGNELWGRYGLHADDPTLQGPHVPALAHIMCASSPQSSRELTFSRTESSLRRSIGRSNSCGTEWPTKRRRVLMEDQPVEDIFSEPFNVGPSKLSLVNALLGKVKDGFTERQSSQHNSETSSSSPIPHTKWLHRTEESSPLRSIKHQAAPTVPETEPAVYQLMPDDGTAVQTHAAKSETNSSDYGDFDEDAFKDAMVDELCADSVPASAPISLQMSYTEIPIPDEPQHQHSILHNPSNGTFMKNDDVDEFGDADEDVWAADFEDIVAKYDAGLPDGSVHSGKLVGDGVHDHSSKSVAEPDMSRPESDDEYCNDFSNLDFEAAEAAATQSLHQLASSPPAVRTNCP